MSRNDLVHQLAQAGARGDRDALQRTMDLLVTEAMDEGKISHARKLASAMKVGEAPSRNKRMMRDVLGPSFLPEEVRGLVHELPARRVLDELILTQDVRDGVREFLDEQAQSALLRANSLEPRHTLLLIGPPGNGKTSLAEVIASELGLMFVTVRYDAIVESYLGETAARLRRITDFATRTPCVLFFDEFDAVGKERGDAHETGEIKRVVSSLLVQLDALPSHCVVVCATNHPELLDRAVWRRFEVRLEIGPPERSQIIEMLRRLARSIGDLGISEDEFVDAMTSQSMSEIEAFSLDVRRRLVLSREAFSPQQAVRVTMDRWLRQTKLGRGQNATYDGSTDRSNTPRRASRNKDKGKASALPSQDDLPGTGRTSRSGVQATR